jgi:hypothetical protein
MENFLRLFLAVFAFSLSSPAQFTGKVESLVEKSERVKETYVKQEKCFSNFFIKSNRYLLFSNAVTGGLFLGGHPVMDKGLSLNHFESINIKHKKVYFLKN